MLVELTRAVWAVHVRNLRLVRRQKNLIAQTVLLPVALLLLVAFIFGGGGDAWPLLVSDEAKDASSAQLIEVLENLRSEITPYYDVIEMNSEQAEALVGEGRAHMFVRIPRDFGSRRLLDVHTFNVNSDATKNVRLRLDYALNVLEREQGLPGVVPVLETEKPKGVWRSAYIGGSSVLLALFLGAMLVAANLFVFDLAHRTRTEMLASPSGFATAGLGIVLSAVVVAILASFVPLALSLALFALSLDVRALVAVYLGILPLLIGCAGAGILLGHFLRTYRAVQPVIVLVAIITFFGTGGFVGVAMLHPYVQLFAEVWLPSRIFEWFNPILHGFSKVPDGSRVGWSLLVATAGLAVTLYACRRERRIPPLNTM